MSLTKEYIKRIRENRDFQPLFDYVLEVYDSLSDDDYDLRQGDDKLGQNLRARIIAKKALYKILLPFIEFKEKSEATEKQKEDARKKYGL